MSAGDGARVYLRRHRSGVLSTISKKLAGYPFSSVVPFVLDHARDLRDCCHHFHERPAGEVRMIGIDCDGFDVRADGAVLRFDFEHPVTDAAAVHEALLAMAGKARAA